MITAYSASREHLSQSAIVACVDLRLTARSYRSCSLYIHRRHLTWNQGVDHIVGAITLLQFRTRSSVYTHIHYLLYIYITGTFGSSSRRCSITSGDFSAHHLVLEVLVELVLVALVAVTAATVLVALEFGSDVGDEGVDALGVGQRRQRTIESRSRSRS